MLKFSIYKFVSPFLKFRVLGLVHKIEVEFLIFGCMLLLLFLLFLLLLHLPSIMLALEVNSLAFLTLFQFLFCPSFLYGLLCLLGTLFPSYASYYFYNIS